MIGVMFCLGCVFGSVATLAIVLMCWHFCCKRDKQAIESARVAGVFATAFIERNIPSAAQIEAMLGIPRAKNADAGVVRT